MAELSSALMVSRQTIRLWIIKWPDFPVRSGGGSGLKPSYDLVDVITFLRREKLALLGQREMKAEPALFSAADLGSKSLAVSRRRWASATWLANITAADLDAIERQNTREDTSEVRSHA